MKFLNCENVRVLESRVAESVVTLLRRNEPSKDLVSQSLSSKLTCEREMAQKALELLLTAQNAIERERDQLTRLLNSCSQLTARSKEREISSQGSCSHCFSIIACFNSVLHCFSMF